MSDRERYHVRLVRPRFEVSYLTVEAPDEDIAKDLALSCASSDAKDWALIDFNPKDYHAYVERCVSDNDLAANEMTADDAEADFSSTEAPKHDKYLLMYADIASGEGELCQMPWLWSEGALMISDLCGDWALGLQEMMENEASEDDIEQELLGGDPSDATKTLLAETLRNRPKKDGPPK